MCAEMNNDSSFHSDSGSPPQVLFAGDGRHPFAQDSPWRLNMKPVRPAASIRMRRRWWMVAMAMVATLSLRIHPGVGSPFIAYVRLSAVLASRVFHNG